MWYSTRSASAYVKPSSPSSVCPSQSSAVGGLRTIASGTPMERASSRSCVLYRSPTGLMPHAISPNCVPYPSRSSVLLLVPRTIPSGHERSYSMLFRSRAILLPIRTLSTFSLRAWKYASTCSVIGTSSNVNPNFWASCWAWSRDSADETRYGVNNPSTFSGPSASVASATVTALSTPPETPTTARRRRAFVVSSRIKRTSILRTRTSSIRRGDGSFGSGRITPVRVRALVTAIERQPETSGDVSKNDVLALVAEQRVARALAGDEIRIDLPNKQVLVELRGARGYGPVGGHDLRSTPERDPIFVPDTIHIDDIHREVRRVEAIHEPARFSGAEVAPFGDAAARACRRSAHARRGGGRVEVGRRDVPQVLANRDAGRAAGPAVRVEAIARAEVATVVEDPVGRQIDLPMHMDELAAGPMALRDVQLRVGRALDEPGTDVEIHRCFGDRSELRIVGGAGHIGSKVLEVIPGQRQLGKNHETRAGRFRASDPAHMHVHVPFDRAERRRALRDGDADAQGARIRSSLSAYSWTSIHARSSSFASAYTLNRGRSASGNTRIHSPDSPSVWCLTPSIWRVRSVLGSCASIRMTRPFCSQGHTTWSRARCTGGVSSMTSLSDCFAATRSSMSRTVAKSPSNDGWKRGKMNPPTPSPTRSGCSRAARLICASADARTRCTRPPCDATISSIDEGA